MPFLSTLALSGRMSSKALMLLPSGRRFLEAAVPKCRKGIMVTPSGYSPIQRAPSMVIDVRKNSVKKFFEQFVVDSGRLRGALSHDSFEKSRLKGMVQIQSDEEQNQAYQEWNRFSKVDFFGFMVVVMSVVKSVWGVFSMIIRGCRIIML